MMEEPEEKSVEDLTEPINELVMKLLVFVGQETRGHHPRDAAALSVAALGLVLTTTIGMLLAKNGLPTAAQITQYIKDQELLDGCAETALREIIPALQTLYWQERAQKADA
jgi:hypothetical protein